MKNKIAQLLRNEMAVQLTKKNASVAEENIMLVVQAYKHLLLSGFEGFLHMPISKLTTMYVSVFGEEAYSKLLDQVVGEFLLLSAMAQGSKNRL